MQIQLGCLTRPWHQFTVEETLAGIAAAGFKTVGVMGSHQGKPVIPAENEAEAIAHLASVLKGLGLKNQVTISNTDVDLPAAEAIAKLKAQIDLASRLGLSHFVLCGTHNESMYEEWYVRTAQVLDYAQERSVLVLLKAHGGMCALAEDLLYALKRLPHPNFGICYDPGNIYYYTGEKAEEDLPKVAQHVKAMCIKDETGGKHGEVMLTPGTGLVDFPRIFSLLNEHGFGGPCWVECVGGTTLDEVNAEAKKTYDFITQVVSSIA
jgi:sugar phosphate isomerase/epimerase